MSENNRIPDYRKMYPDASEEIIRVLRSGKRKMIYHEYDLKVERIVADAKTQTVKTRPSREDSLERLMDENVQFPSHTIGTEEAAIREIMHEQLWQRLKELDPEEYAIIRGCYFDGKTEAVIAAEFGISQQLLNYRKKKVLMKLRKLLENKK